MTKGGCKKRKYYKVIRRGKALRFRFRMFGSSLDIIIIKAFKSYSARYWTLEEQKLRISRACYSCSCRDTKRKLLVKVITGVCLLTDVGRICTYKLAVEVGKDSVKTSTAFYLSRLTAKDVSSMSKPDLPGH
jgi:hypothetical protein